MKNKWLLLLALLLCAGMMFAVACQPTPDEPDDDVPPEVALPLLNEDGTFRYTVVRSEKGGPTDPETRCAVNIRNALQEKLGVSVPIKDDWEKNPEAAELASRYEILVGNTNRPESVEAAAALTEYSWTIRVVGNKIVILGSNDKATTLATDVFINTYINGEAVISETLSVTNTFVPDPTDILPEDKSNGKTGVFLIETKYPTDDIVIADIHVVEQGYAVDPTGKSDSTAGIQKALDDCDKAGGGTVWLPAGVYVISDTITIPPYVTLRGDWQDPDAGSEYGTIISVWNESKEEYSAGSEVSEGIFELGGSGGVVGLTVYYPHQSVENVRPYPFTFYTDGIGNNYMLSTIKNVTVINGYRGIGACCTSAGAHEQLTVENFKGTFLYCGTEVYNQADVGTWQDVTISPKYWKQALGAAAISTLSRVEGVTEEGIADYVKEKAVGLKLGDLEWTEFESLKVDGCKIGIEIVKGKRIQFAGSLHNIEIRNCKQGLLVSDLDPRWGMVIAHSIIENGIRNKTQGVVKLCDVAASGEIKGQILASAESLADFVVDYKASYKKPVAKLYVVDFDGNGDATAAIQAKLNEAAATGGVVYLPAGVYRVEGMLTVPAGVELRGASSVATREQSWKSGGTLLQCYYGDDNYCRPDHPAFITLAGDYAGINGIRIVYPENGAYDEDLNTTYTVCGRGKGVYMVNSMIAGSAYGVDFRGCDEHFIKKVTTCCYDNSFLLGGSNGILAGCLQNGTVLCRTAAPNLENWLAESNVFNDLFDPITRVRNEYIILDGATNQQIYNTFVYGCRSMLVNRNSTGTLAVNIGSDNIGDNQPQIVCESGSLTVINSMRYNGYSYNHTGGTLALYNRLTIGTKNEQTYINQK